MLLRKCVIGIFISYITRPAFRQHHLDLAIIENKNLIMEDNNLDTATDDDRDIQNGPNYLSDVIEVIATDPDFRESTRTTNNKMFNGGGEIQPPAPQKPPLQPRSSTQAYIRIVEQPASKALRFRYECEGRSAGSIPGASSTPENKTFPTIQVMGYQGRAVVVVSCVTKDPPHRPHPHNLVGREGCKRGVCTIEIPTETMTVHFSNLGIQCVKKKDIEHALKVREEIRVDPFRTGFSHRNQPTTIDLNTVRLCFQVFLEGDTPGKFSKHLTPVVSEPIYDKKAMSDLSIVKLSQCFSYVDGGRNDIILLCEKVAKEDIQVRFYEDNGDWEAYADFQPSQVHKQHAIWFQTPRYKNIDVTEPVKVLIQLRRPSDGATSESLPFEFLPAPRRKRPKMDNPSQILRDLQGHTKADQFPSSFPLGTIKTEPRETSTSPYQGSPYSGMSPGYVPNVGTSPLYNISFTPTPQDTFQYTRQSPHYLENNTNQELCPPSTSTPVLPSNWTVLPEVNNAQKVTWNIPTASSQAETNVLFNLDTGNSEEIEMFVKSTTTHNMALPVLQLSSEIGTGLDAEMTDSLTKLANFTLDNIMNQ